MKQCPPFSLCVAIALLLSAGCTRYQAISLLPVSHATICDLVDNQSIAGRSYVVEAVLESDNLTFESLVDRRCGAGGSRIELDGGSADADQSVNRFFREKQTRCERTGQPALCGLSAEMQVEVVVAREGNGRRIARLRKVVSFRFLDD